MPIVRIQTPIIEINIPYGKLEIQVNESRVYFLVKIEFVNIITEVVNKIDTVCTISILKKLKYSCILIQYFMWGM